MGGFPGWQTDPTERHQERYFDSAGVPTALVRNDGIEFTDEDRVTTSGNSSPMVEDSELAPSPTEQPTGNGGRATPPANTDALLVSRYKALTLPNTTCSPVSQRRR